MSRFAAHAHQFAKYRSVSDLMETFGWIQPAVAARSRSQSRYREDDEFVTPDNAVAPILRYLKPGSSVLCPFDMPTSPYVQMLRAAGHTVRYGHLRTGDDFFQRRKPRVDYIVSNPPYSERAADVFGKLTRWNVPFAMLIGIDGVWGTDRRIRLWEDYDLQILVLRFRVRFAHPYRHVGKPAPWTSVYLCRGVLPRQVCFSG